MSRTDHHLKALAEAAAVAEGAPPRAIGDELATMLQEIEGRSLIGAAADRYATSFGRKQGRLYRPIAPGEIRDIAERAALYIMPKALRSEKFWKRIEEAEATCKARGYSPKRTRAYIQAAGRTSALVLLPPDAYTDHQLREAFLEGMHTVVADAEMDLEAREAAQRAVVKVRERGDVERSSRSTMRAAGHHWMISQGRSAEARQRREVALAEQQLKEEKERARQAHFVAVAIPELKRILHTLRESPNATPTRINAILYFEQIYLFGKRVDDLKDMFPGVNRDLAYKWKERVLDAVMKVASPTLKEWLNERSPSKTRKER